MSGAQQTCPFCDWYRWQDIPDQMVGDHRDELLEHVARSLQWEWQVHAMELHPKEAAALDCLTVGAFTSWVTGERQTTSVEVGTPPGEGVGKTVGVNLPHITPEQARNLADAVERIMVSVAENIQRFAEHTVPAINAAQDTLVRGLRELVDPPERRHQPGCDCDGKVASHLMGDPGCMFMRIPAGKVALRRDAQHCDCDGYQAGHPMGSEGCLFTPVPGGFTVDPNGQQPATVTVDPGDAQQPYGVVHGEICSNCQRLTGEPHGLPSCADLS